MRVLFATDGSTSAAIAEELILNIRWPTGTSVDVVRVLDDIRQNVVIGPWPAAGVPISRAELAAELQQSRTEVLRIVERLRSHGLKSDLTVVRGRPIDVLCDRIVAYRPDLVIAGSRGLNAMQRTLLGSVSSELVDRSPVPVLVARRPFLERVVVAVDGSHIADEAVRTVAGWRFLADADIDTLSIAPTAATWWPIDPLAATPDVPAHERDAIADALLEHDSVASEAAATLTAAGLRAHAEVRTGTAAPEIVEYAARVNADLIVLGSHGRTGLKRMLLGSVARNVLHRAQCSVVIVPRHVQPLRRGEPVRVKGTPVLSALG